MCRDETISIQDRLIFSFLNSSFHHRRKVFGSQTVKDAAIIMEHCIFQMSHVFFLTYYSVCGAIASLDFL